MRSLRKERSVPMRIKRRSSRRRSLWVPILILGVVTTGLSAQDPPGGLEEALEHGRVSDPTIRSVMGAAARLDWSAIPERADMEAVALALAYAERANRLPNTASDAARFALELAREAITLSTAGFSRRDVARMLAQSTRTHTEPVTTTRPQSFSAATRREAAQTMRDQVRRKARETVSRRMDRPYDAPPGVIPPLEREGAGTADSPHTGDDIPTGDAPQSSGGENY